jgi:hypothetical protein
MKTPTVLLLTSVLALAPATAMAQHLDVTMNAVKGSTRNGVKATMAADTMKSGTKSV